MVFDRDSSKYRTCCCHVKNCTIAIGILELIGLILQVISGAYQHSIKEPTSVSILTSTSTSTSSPFVFQADQFGSNSSIVDWNSLANQLGNSTITDWKFLSSYHQLTRGSLAGTVVGLVVGIIVVVLLFVGVCKENHRFLIPHLVFQIIGMILMAVGIVLMALGLAAVTTVGVVAAADGGEGGKAVGAGLLIVVIILCIIFGVAIFFELWFFVVVLKCYRFFRDQREATYQAEVPMQQGGGYNYYKN